MKDGNIFEVGKIVVDSVGDFFTVCRENDGCQGCDKYGGGCKKDREFIVNCIRKCLIYKHVSMCTINIVPASIKDASSEQLVNELRLRGFKGEIEKNEIITATITEKHVL